MQRTPFRCELCDYNARDNYDLNKHFASNKHSKKAYKNTMCRYCSKILANKFSLTRHIATFHPHETESPNFTNGLTYGEIMELDPHLDYVDRHLFRQLKFEQADIMDHMAKFEMYLSAIIEDNTSCQECSGGKVCDMHLIGCDKIIKALTDSLTSSCDKLTLMPFRRYSVEKYTMLYKHKGKYYSSEILIRMIHKSSLKIRMVAVNHEYLDKAIEREYVEFVKRLTTRINSSTNRYNNTNRKRY